VIKAPSSFPYKNEKVVPWRYGVSVMKGEQNGEQIDEALDTEKVVIENIKEWSPFHSPRAKKGEKR